MGRLIDGDWKTTDQLTENDQNRSDDEFRDRISSVPSGGCGFSTTCSMGITDLTN